jgi:hypothetical protein
MNKKKQNILAFEGWGMSRVRAHTPYKGEKGFPRISVNRYRDF